MILKPKWIWVVLLGISVPILSFEGSICMAGQVYQDKESCVTIISQPHGARLSISGSVLLGGRSPSTFCSLKPGEKYKLTLEKRGFEKRSGILLISSDSAEPVIKSYLVANTLKSLVIPGLGQMSSGETWKGVENCVFSIGAALGAFLAYDEYKDERGKYRIFYRELDSALTEAKKAIYSRELRRAAIRTNKSREYMFITVGIFGWAYLTNIAETFLGSFAPGEVKRTGRSFTMRIPRKSVSKALARSLFSPGLGQRYLGNDGRGFLFQALFLSAAFLAADSWKDYRTASAEYDVACTDLEKAQSHQEIQEARIELETRWGDLRDREKVRNAYLITAASIWVLNILDVMNSSYRQNNAGLNLDFYSGVDKAFTGIAISF